MSCSVITAAIVINIDCWIVEWSERLCYCLVWCELQQFYQHSVYKFNSTKCISVYILNVSDTPIFIFSQYFLSSQKILFQWKKVVPCFDHMYKYHCACCEHHGAADYSQIEGVIQPHTGPMKLVCKLFREATSKTWYRNKKAYSCEPREWYQTGIGTQVIL